MSLLKAEFTRFSHGGEALGDAGGRQVAAIGVIPGETAEVLPFGRKRKIRGCLPCRIISPSPCRVPPREAHYLSCSPWQVISRDFQNEFKSRLLSGIFREIAGEQIPVEAFFPSPCAWGYRTKMEFSFAIESGRLLLAFNERGGACRKIPLPEGCSLAGEKLNSAANSLVSMFNELNLTGGVLKTLTMRESKGAGKIVASLAVKDENFNPGALSGALRHVNGFITVYSDSRTPSSAASKILSVYGDDFLQEDVLGRKFSYGYDGFFQNNIPQFEAAIGLMSENIPAGSRITELYAGAGVIGISLAGRAREITGVEVSASGSERAIDNAKANGVSNYRVLNMPSEKTPRETLQASDVLVLDPPRTGLAPKLAKRIALSGPGIIAYLSCSPATQAADYLLLKENYAASKLYGFDFHPQTPHIESLLFLERR